MKKMNCIAIDDEPLALDVIEDYIKKVDFLNLVKKCNKALGAIDLLQTETVDLMFLDIQMPGITGVQFAKSIKNLPPIIFTTAYSNYAVEGFELDAVDYLVKPFTFERFLKAAGKAYSIFKMKDKVKSDKIKHGTKDFIFVKSEYKNIRLNFDDILYIEGLSDYIKIHLTDGKYILSLQSLKAFCEKLPENRFSRIHRSYIIPLNKINSIQKHCIYIDKKQITIGAGYKESFFKKIEQFGDF